MAQDFGVQEGLTIPLRGGTALGWGGIGLSATRMKPKEWYALLASYQKHLERLSQAFHEFVLSKGYFNLFNLSPREKEVLNWVVCGLSKYEIADKLKISYRTSEVHIYQIRRKLGCVNDAQVTAKALVLNLID